MKKLIALALTLAFIASMTVVVLANPNSGPGVPSITLEDVVVSIVGNGNSARIVVTTVVDGETVSWTSPNRPANNRYNAFTTDCGITVDVFVRGNSILDASVNVQVPVDHWTQSTRYELVETSESEFEVVDLEYDVSFFRHSGNQNTLYVNYVSWTLVETWTTTYRRVTEHFKNDVLQEEKTEIAYYCVDGYEFVEEHESTNDYIVSGEAVWVQPDATNNSGTTFVFESDCERVTVEFEQTSNGRPSSIDEFDVTVEVEPVPGPEADEAE